MDKEPRGGLAGAGCGRSCTRGRDIASRTRAAQLSEIMKDDVKGYTKLRAQFWRVK
jgi:hypothetical protein